MTKASKSFTISWYKQDFIYSLKRGEQNRLTEEEVWKRKVWVFVPDPLCVWLSKLVKETGGKRVPVSSSHAGGITIPFTDQHWAVSWGRRAHRHWQVTAQKSGGRTNGRWLRIGGRDGLFRKARIMRKTAETLGFAFPITGRCARGSCHLTKSHPAPQPCTFSLLLMSLLGTLSGPC